jgi:hypothetical protein
MIYFFMLVYLYIYNILDVINFLQLVYYTVRIRADFYYYFSPHLVNFDPDQMLCAHTRTAPLCADRAARSSTDNERQGWWQIGDP